MAYKTTDFIKEQPLVLLIKLFLQTRNLGDVYTGGVGSYLLYCMVLSFLQLHDSTCIKASDSTNTLATLYIDFFYYWGFIRDYDQFSTCVRGYGHVFPRRLWKTDNTSLLSCESPLEPMNDIGKNAHNMHIVRAVFQRAFIILKRGEADFNKSVMQNTFAYKKNRTLLELLYDCVHPIFQNRNKGDKCSNLRNTYLYESHKTDRKVLNNVCEELRRVLDSTAKYKFNAQRQLIDSLTSKLNKSQDGDLPFYIIAESVANDENNDSK